MIGAADVRGLVHITGGGFPENIPRVVPKGLAARIRRSAWEVPPLFQWVQEVSRGRGFRAQNGRDGATCRDCRVAAGSAAPLPGCSARLPARHPLPHQHGRAARCCLLDTLR